MPHMRNVGLTVVAASLAAVGGAGTANAAPASHQPSHHHASVHQGGAHQPALSSEAQAHGVNTQFGAIPGWKNKHLSAASQTSPAPSSSSGMSPMMRSAAVTAPTTPIGIDVSGWSGTVNWSGFKAQGYNFTYVKISEGNYMTSKPRYTQLAGAKAQGFLTGGYHFANPQVSSGTSQADYFVANGGGWSPGKLPGALDMEWNPYKGTNSCYGLSRAQMTSWIADFQSEYMLKTGTYPVIYTAPGWWNMCVSDDVNGAVLSARSGLWDAVYSSSVGTMPRGWASQRVWQYAAVNTGAYDLNRFNGSQNMLQAFARYGR